MAPGPFEGYGKHDSFCSEFVVNVLRNKDYYMERHRDVDRRRSQGGDLRKMQRNRDYVKERILPVMNDVNGNMHDLGWVSKSLDSEDSSGIEDGVIGSEDKDEDFSVKKRKFLPVDLDMDEKNCRNFRQWKRIKECSPVDPKSDLKILRSEGFSVSLDQKTSVDSILRMRLENDDVYERMGEEYVPASTISLSRWADLNDSFDEDDQRSNFDDKLLPNRRKNIPLASIQDVRLDNSEISSREGSDIDSMDVCGEDSNGEESDGSFTSSERSKLRTLDSAEPSCRSINMMQGCRTVDEFEKLNKINEGAYGVVYRAKDKRTGKIVALKKVKMEREREGFPLTSLREINILLSLQHPSIVEVKEVVVGMDLDSVFTVMEYMEHDLKRLIETMKKPFHISEVKCLMMQLFAGVKFLHDNWVLHRDLKTSNLLFNNRGELKICDFGLSRQYGSPLKPYTKLVVTLWYRAPELLLGAKEYSTSIDMWSLGCIMAELLTQEPLFPGKSELDQLDKIFKVLGTPDEKIWPGFSRLPGAKVNFAKKPFKLQEKFPRTCSASFLGRPSLSAAGFNLLTKLLTYDPEKRITAEDALNHPWFHESPLPTTKEFMPTFPDQLRQNRHQQRIIKSSGCMEQLVGENSQQRGTGCSLEKIFWSTMQVMH